MQGTRDRILELLLERREARVEALAEELAITPAAVRRHLDNLRADGLVEVRAVKQPTGRPYYAYHPTELAAGALPAGYADLLRRMLEGLGERQEVVSAVMESVAASLAERHRSQLPDVSGLSTATRVALVTDSMRAEGILDGWRAEEDGFHLINGVCPYLKAAEMSNLPCESDRKAIELLLEGEVQQLHRIVDGSPVCEYLVRAISGPEATLIDPDLIEVN